MNTTTLEENDNLNFKNKITTSNVNIDFMPTKESLSHDLLKIKEFIYQSNKCVNTEIKLIANSGLILLLIPLLISIKDRLSVEFRFEENSSESLFSSNYENCRNFKDVLETSIVLQKLCIKVGFSKSLSKI
jgi:hypothetical protein